MAIFDKFGKLFLIGDAAHFVPPTGAKGLNLAASDISTLYQLLIREYNEGEVNASQRYSEIALRRVWHAKRFSWWMSNMLHDFEDDSVEGLDVKAFQRFMKSELDFFFNNEAGQKVMAIQYVGMPYEQV